MRRTGDSPTQQANAAPSKARAAGGLSDLWPGQSVPLLEALGVVTAKGAITADARRKVKQVQHLVTLLNPFLDAAFAAHEEPVLADLGAGKSYLGFVLYDLVFGPKERGRVIGIEARADLAAKSAELAHRFAFARFAALHAQIGEAGVDGPAHMVTALHACDTATDDAIRFALAHDAKWIALVPCCQAEAARLIDGLAVEGVDALWRRPLHRREFGSQITNVIRALYLESKGYKVRVTEFVGFEHAMKNELILAERHQRANAMAERELAALLRAVPVRLGLIAGEPYAPQARDA